LHNSVYDWFRNKTLKNIAKNGHKASKQPGTVILLLKISPTRDWRSTPTYCQLKSHV